MIRAIEAVYRGEGFFSPPVAAAMMASLAGPPVAAAGPDAACLTARERDVITLIAAGHSNKTIAQRRGIALATVKTLRERLMRKLDLHSVAALTHFAMEQGLCEPPLARVAAR
ncbi:MAG: response regulator transcription factor [Limisphaerales bacterium]